jgi:hypothetical protein
MKRALNANKYKRHLEGRPKGTSRRMATNAALGAILRDGRAQARDLLRMTSLFVARLYA